VKDPWEIDRQVVLECVNLLQSLKRPRMLHLGRNPGALLWCGLLTTTISEVTWIDHSGEEEPWPFGHQKLPYPTSSYDTVVALELLDRVVDPEAAISELCRVATEYVLIAAPSMAANAKFDRAFSPDALRYTLANAGFTQILIHQVSHHRIALGRVAARSL
jgi:hypothetical protein